MAKPQQQQQRRRTRQDAPRRGRRKVCVFCAQKIAWVDYKDVNLLRRFMSDRGKIRARRVSGNCSQHQRDVAVAIKTARELALLPYSQRTVSERTGGRGRGGPRRDQAREAEAEVPEVPEVAEVPEVPEAAEVAAFDEGDQAEQADQGDQGDAGEEEA